MHERGCHGWVKQQVQESETLCRKGGTSRSDNAPHASGARAGAKLACGATLSATREFAGLVQVLNSLVVVAMITTRELLAPWGLSIYFMGQFFACLFCGNQSIACTQFQAGFFAKTANAVLAEKGKSERVKVKQKLIPRNQQRVKGTTESSRHGSRWCRCGRRERRCHGTTSGSCRRCRPSRRRAARGTHHTAQR